LVVVFISVIQKMEAAVGMWKSRAPYEISKRRWKSFCDFHGRVISKAESELSAKTVEARAPVPEGAAIAIAVRVP
jgi:hypothetical protein